MAKTIYMLTCDYGGLDNFYEAAFVDESERNEIALAIAEEMEWCNFNLNVAAWMSMGMREGVAVKTAMRQSLDWSRANPAIGTWEVTLYGG
jgi:hypothetical protein